MAENEGHDAIIDYYVAGATSAPSALAQLLLAHGDADGAMRALRDARAHLTGGRHEPGSVRMRLDALEALLPTVDAGTLRIVRMLRDGVDPSLPAATADTSPDAVLDACRRAFDSFVVENEAASVALYSLGSERLLEQTTREIIALLEAWNVLGPDRTVLDLGCGIGRLEPLLAPRARMVHAIDLSPNMVAAARRRCAELRNVRVDPCTGRDLTAFGDASFDTVIAADSFPYLVASGPALVERHMGEARRVLRPGGNLAILNFSYRGVAAEDRADVARLADAFGFDVLVDGVRPFALWDAVVFHLRRRDRP